MIQNTSKVIMIRPKHFNYNIETADNNYFQKRINNLSSLDIKQKSIEEFNMLVCKLEDNNITVDVFDDREDIITTDSVFPNNWFSLHKNGILYLYPMFSKNRRRERRNDIVEYLNNNYHLNQIIDLTKYEEEKKFLEGTGSMVLDRIHKICYASISERTDLNLLNSLCEKLEYDPITFRSYHTVNKKRKEIYHTNVIMNIGENYSIISLECIDNKNERDLIIRKLENTGKEIIEISEFQLNNFAGNMLEIENENNKKFIVMSKRAYKSLDKDQITAIENYNEIIYSDLNIIETLGGGSARCMIAENFLEKK